MSKSVIGALRVNLGLDSAQFTRGLSQAQKNLAAARLQFAAVAGAATAAFGAIQVAALRGARAIDDAAKAARRIDASVAGFRALEMAADDAGVSLSSLANDVQTMNREIAKNSAGAQQALQSLGIAASDLAGLDADQKLALIADRVKGLGLDSGQTSVALQQLGVRNREMALLVMGGGNALRQARIDVEQFGLAISDVDAARIEAANDELAGLADITTYIGDQLALKFVPAMGNMAKAMTDSLREGGALRGVIDGVIKNLDVLAVSVGAAVAAMGAKVAVLAALTSGTGLFTAALGAARVAVAALLGPMGLVYVAIGTVAAAFVAYRNDSDKAVTAMDQTATAASELGIELGLLANDRGLPAVSAATVALANDNLTLASTAFEAARAQLELAKANAQAAFSQRSVEAAFLPGTEPPSSAAYDAANRALVESANALNEAEAELNRRIAEGNAVKVEASEAVVEVSDALTDAARSGGAASAAMATLDKAAEDLGKTMSGPLSAGVDGVADAFGDLVTRGFRDFKSFTASIIGTFKDMIRQMVVTAARNRIMINLGMGGVGGVAQAGSSLLGAAGGGGGMLAGVGGLGGLGSAFMGGASFFASGVTSGFAAGGIGGAFAGGSAAVGTALSSATAGLGGLAAAAGAVALPLAALYGTFKFFQKTTKELDSGLKVAVDGMNASVSTFRRTQTSRFFGLSKSTRTSKTVDPDSPIGAAIGEMQNAALQAARVLGTGAAAFEDFTYDFRLSLKGLSEDERQAKVQAELTKLGDSFAGLVPNIQNLNQLLEQAAQISANIRALTDRQGLFVTQADAVFAASQVANQRPTSTIDDLVDTMAEVLRAIREGDINQARLLSQSVALQQRTTLGPAT